jgi:hypothetical protein
MKPMLHGAVSVGTFITCTLQEVSGVEITVGNAAAVRFYYIVDNSDIRSAF